jgi:hypothetical protein
MAWEDGAISSFTANYPPMTKYAVAALGAAFVVGLGRILAGRTLQRSAERQRDNLEEVEHPPKAPAANDPVR